MKYKHFPKDPRLVVVDKLEDIPRLSSVFGNILGVLCPYDPLSKPELQQITDFMRSRIELNEACNIYASNYHDRALAKTLPQSLLRVFNDLNTIFIQAIGGGATRRVLRANSNLPVSPHMHETTISYTLKGIGTLCEDADGKLYPAPEKHMLIIGPKLRHMASQEHSKNNIKLTALAF